MKRWEASQPGIGALRLIDGPAPSAGPGEALVRVQAVSLNYRDGQILEGRMAGAWTATHLPGTDMAGEVVAVGSGVDRVALGDRVITVDVARWIDGPTPEPGTNTAPFGGHLAELAVVPADLLVRAPATLDAVAASTLPVAALTAWFALVELAKVRAGQTILVHGTGGVAVFVIQFAVAHGARVIAVTGSPDKITRVEALGAHAIVRSSEWPARALALTDGRGVDHVLEIAGGDLGPSLEALALGGRISIIGLLEATELRATIMTLLWKRAELVAIGVGHRRAQEDMVRAIDALALKPVVDAVHDFADTPAAFAHLARGAFGKVVIRVAD